MAEPELPASDVLQDCSDSLRHIVAEKFVISAAALIRQGLRQERLAASTVEEALLAQQRRIGNSARMPHPPKLLPVTFAALAALASLTATAPSAVAKPKTLQGTIRHFECGDNCYLVILDKAKQEQTGLCMAPQCEDWNASVEMPKRFIGKRVSVTVGTGQQLDGNGDVMGDFMSFTSIKFLN